MQTFLPYPDIIKSVRCLDNKRLGKQRVEAYQILKVLDRIEQARVIVAKEYSNKLYEVTRHIAWANHPAVRMWSGYETSLEYYMNECINEWENRGFNNTMLKCTYGRGINCDFVYPSWFGDKNFHDSHKSNLMRKDPIWYGQFGWNVPGNLPYVWPV